MTTAPDTNLDANADSQSEFSQSLLTSLNESQQEAVKHFRGPALVLAGAGSGKTRTVVHRIAYLMSEHEVYPTEILAVTFTNKAASELKERVEALIGQAGRDLWGSTFHSACLRILRAYGEHIELMPGFVIYDTTDQLDVLKELLKSITGLEQANPRTLRSIIDRAKSNLWSPSDLAQSLNQEDLVYGMPVDMVIETYNRYQMRLRQANAVDFNDILSRTVELFDDHPEILDKVQQRAVFTHVDEYQDTNAVQYKLTKQFTNSYDNLMVVGDPDQSIYAFRGADVRNILDFKKDYSEAEIYRLELNYRSSGNILSLANNIIARNEDRLEKNLKAVKGAGESVKVYRASDNRAEADFVARQVERLLAELDADYNDFCILYRTNSQSRVLEEALRRHAIPGKIVGGVGFYDRREVKDILSYARACLNPSDDIAWRRIVNTPKRGIGKTSVEKVVKWAQKNSTSFSNGLKASEESLSGSAAAKKKVTAFTELMDDLVEAAQNRSALEFLAAVIDQSGYKASLRQEASFEAESRLENLDELLNAVAEWQEETDGSIEEFLDEAALLASVDDKAVKANNKGEEISEAVTLMTLHNAKGLEFPIVFLVGMEENLMPHRSSLGSMAEIEEERRLLYVGITRSQEELYLVYCESRQTFGNTEYVRPTRFLEDVPKEMLMEVDIMGQEMSVASLDHQIIVQIS